MDPDIPFNKTCHVQPLGVMQNAVFIIDLDSVEFDDIKADDLGSWRATGNKKQYFKIMPSGAIKYLQAKPADSKTQYYLLTRRYFVHQTYGKFHRMLADVQGITCFFL